MAIQGYQGTALWFRMYNSFGYLNTKGYGGHLFPVFIGEVGSKFETQTDIQSLNDMTAWFLAKPNTGAQHNPVRLFSWLPIQPSLQSSLASFFTMLS